MLHLHTLQLLFAAIFLIYPFPIYKYSRVNKGTVTTMPILRSVSARFAAALDTKTMHNERVKAIHFINDESSGRITKQQMIHAFDQLKKEDIQQKTGEFLGKTAIA